MQEEKKRKPRNTRKPVNSGKMTAYLNGDNPQRVNTSIPEKLLGLLAKTFALGNRGSGKKSALLTLGLWLVLFGAGAGDVTAAQVAAAIVALFPDPAQSQTFATNLWALADYLENSAVPVEDYHG